MPTLLLTPYSDHHAMMRDAGRKGMPIDVRPQMLYNPAMRAIILRGANFFEYWPNLLVLIVMSNLLFSLCALRFRKKLA
jgi:hypothetical protein